jgi:hypothetical protein
MNRIYGMPNILGTHAQSFRSAGAHEQSFFVPEGLPDNSPAFQRRVKDGNMKVPSGTAEQIRSVVPDGTRFSVWANPGVETPGYYQMSLRDNLIESPRAKPDDSPK